MRKAAQISGAVLLTGILGVLVTGCGSGSADKNTTDDAKAAAAPAKPSSDSATDTKPGDDDRLDGMWNRQDGDDISRVTIVGDHGIAASKQGVCQGPVQRSGAKVKFDLKCPTGDDPHAKATASLSDDGKALTVTWGNGRSEKFTKDPIKVDMPKIDIPKIDVPTVDPAG